MTLAYPGFRSGGSAGPDRDGEHADADVPRPHETSSAAFRESWP